MMTVHQIEDPFEPTPAQFHSRVEQKLRALQAEKAPARRPYRFAAVLAACLVLLGGTAVALNHFGVHFFLTERTYMGAPVNEKAIVQPVTQTCDSALLDASAQDAYWDGETLSLTVRVTPKGGYAFYTETDRGQDGESFDMIWWQGKILPYDEWRAGREGLKLSLPEITIDGNRALCSLDWVQDGQGETLLIEGKADDMTKGAKLSIALTSTLENTNTTETATLSVTLPPMTKGEVKE